MSLNHVSNMAWAADQEVLANSIRASDPDTAALTLQIDRLRWANAGLAGARGDVWNPVADLVISSIESIVLLIGAWQVLHRPLYSEPDPSAADLLQQGYERLIDALDQFDDAAQQAETGDIDDDRL